MAKDRIESKYVTVAPGVELHILEKGEGKPLVFMHLSQNVVETFIDRIEVFNDKRVKIHSRH